MKTSNFINFELNEVRMFDVGNCGFSHNFTSALQGTFTINTKEQPKLLIFFT